MSILAYLFQYFQKSSTNIDTIAQNGQYCLRYQLMGYQQRLEKEIFSIKTRVPSPRSAQPVRFHIGLFKLTPSNLLTPSSNISSVNNWHLLQIELKISKIQRLISDIVQRVLAEHFQGLYQFNRFEIILGNISNEAFEELMPKLGVKTSSRTSLLQTGKSGTFFFSKFKVMV